MAALSQQESRKRYSWWWDSHISPKNSKWLQENLTGMDSKVKQMIKLIEEDADSFARRAEMYYKRRPELMRLVEEFYRAYRGLAERYDHATGVIRHAHKTMVEAFPDQDPSLMGDDVDAFSPFMPPSVRDFFDPEELQKDALGLSSPDIQVPKRKGLKQIDFFEKGARKSLNFNEAREKILNNGNNNNVGYNQSKHSLSKHDADISLLKEALAKLEAEKEAGLLNYQNSLERLSSLEKEIRFAQEDSDKLTERAIKAEAEVELLNGALMELKAAKELLFLQYQQCLNKISILEEQIIRHEQDVKETSDRAERLESEIQQLKQDIVVLQAEKEATAAQHEQCVETITVVETKLQHAEESVRRANERAKVAESKVETLNLDIIELTEEKKAFSLECQQYLERISSLEFQILFSQEEAQRLKEEISKGEDKLKEAEEQCFSIATAHVSLQADLDSLIRKMEFKNKELTEKQIELNRLWTCVQEERSRFVEAETAFQTLQHLHNESQEELTALASELQNRAQTVLNLEERNHGLQEEVLKIKEENRTLIEINLSSAVSMENMQDEISSLRTTIVKLHEEIQIRVNERNVLQQEIYSLRDEFNELKLKHGALLEQMESLELDPESFGSSVMELRDNSLKLNDAYQMEKSEKVALLEKLEIMAILVEKNAVLENSIAGLNAELQQVKDKVRTLEETCHLLVEERSTIVAEKNALQSQIQILTENAGILLEKNVSLENSLAGANTDLDVLKEKSRRLEDSLLLTGIEKAGLLDESATLSSQLEVTKHRLEVTEINCEELIVKNFDLEIGKQLLVCSIDELYESLNSAKQENSDTAKFYHAQLASLESQLHLLQEEAQLTKNLYYDELDTTARAETEIFILQCCLQGLHGNNISLGRKCLELFEASQTSEKIISDLEQKNADQEVESEALLDVLEKLREEFCQITKTLSFVKGVRPGYMFEDTPISHQPHSNQILETAKDIKKALTTTLDENQQLLQEKSVLITLLQQLQLEAVDLDVEKCILSQNLKASAQRLLELSAEVHAVKETNEGLERNCLELYAAAQISEKLISNLEQKHADQQMESKALLDVFEKLRAGFYQMSRTLDFDKGISSECMYKDIPFSNQIHSNQIMETVEGIKEALMKTLDEKQQLLLEKSVFITLLRQLQLDAVDLDAEKCILSQNLTASAQKLVELSAEVHTVKETNDRLERNCLELFQASQISEKLISNLEQKHADQHVESKALLDVLEKLRDRFHQMSRTLDFDKDITSDWMFEEVPFSNQIHSNQILEAAEGVNKALTTTLDENQQLLLEKSVHVTLLQQLRLEAVDREVEMCILTQNLKASAERLLELSSEVHVLKETNAGLEKIVEEREYSEEMLRNDIKGLSLKLLGVQESYQKLQQAQNLVLEEKKSVMNELVGAKGENSALKEEIYEILGDAVSLNSSHLVFQDFFSDKSIEVKELGNSMSELHHIKDTLEDIIRKLEEELEIMLDDKSSLMESLEESDVELKTLKSINSQLKDEVSNGKLLLHQRELDLSEAKLKFETLLNEQSKLQSAIEDLKRGYENEKAIKEEQTEQISKLVKENELRTVENDDLRGSKHSLETELLELITKHENVKTRELRYEKEYEELFREQQISAILEACYHEKFQELCKKYESTLSTLNSVDSEAELLKERVMALEVENAGLEAHFNEYDSAVKSLSNSVASLECHTIFHEKLSSTINVTKDAGTKQENAEEDNSNTILPTICSELKNLQGRIQAIEVAVDDIQKHASEGSIGSSVRAQASMGRTKELESGRSFRKERARRQRRRDYDTSSEITELPKDIMLDSVSDCSSYCPSKRENMAADNQMLESWGTTNNDSYMNFSNAKAHNPRHVTRTSSPEITAEKEMTVVDKLEISKSSKNPQQTGKKVKILERLLFDAEKLANLQKSVQDLKSKIGIAEKSRKTKGVIEYDAVKEQLEEAAEAIEKLFGVNEKLTRSVEDDSLSSKYENGSDESATLRRRRVLEQIRRASEKISRLHFEVQKLQFLLLKLEDEKEVTVKTKVIPRSPRVRLRDYLYGNSKQVFAHKQKRRQFCACIKPSTKGD